MNEEFALPPLTNESAAEDLEASNHDDLVAGATAIAICKHFGVQAADSEMMAVAWKVSAQFRRQRFRAKYLEGEWKID